ncbi:PREDICTED: shugoshin-1-like isoform X3 [Populus euphratica]|uniref:Shugoshin-1-like isoform X3 n=1 Tax=Populus euphratica TaxID=75702 RepID=A0AAJ6ULV2_POPEU|nr:PREDICTED: shugoshin-1-like isoform X3 [Populus euphratica]
MEGILVLDSENINVAGNKIKGEKLRKGSMIGIAPRRTLADISNFPVSRKTLAEVSSFSQRNQDGKSQSVVVGEDYIEKLQREIMTLTKIVVDRNKIIELSAIELQKLRIRFQQLQQQNQQLAQTNSQMLAELNAGKDKLKVFQHELGCKSGLLDAINLELKEKAKKVRCQIKRNEVETIKGDGAEQLSQPEEENKPCNPKGKRKANVQSLETRPVQPQTKENADKKSVCLRRQSARFKSGEEEPTENNVDTKSSPDSFCLGRHSARFKSEEQLNEKNDDKRSRTCRRKESIRIKSEAQIEEPTEDLFQTDDAKFHVPAIHGDPVHESCPTLSAPSVKIKSETGNGALRFETQEPRRTSLRPSCRAAEKVQSYKEIPLNVKMRRNTEEHHLPTAIHG